MSLFNSSLCAQEITNETQFLRLNISPSQSPPNNLNILVDSLYVTQQKLDTTNFEIKTLLTTTLAARFIKSGDHVYQIKDQDSVLVYDYSLTIGDTFPVTFYSINHLLILDSITDKTFANGRKYKHWHLHTVDPTVTEKIVWVEGLGEQNFGWDYSLFASVHQPFVIGICIRDTLVNWRKIEEIKHISPSCNFDLIRKSLSLDKLKNHQILVYPNPTSSILTILPASQSFSFGIITNTNGAVVKRFEVRGQIELDIRDLKSGIYFLIIDDVWPVRIVVL